MSTVHRHAAPRHKHIKLKAKHARAYRKRHVLLLLFSLFALAIFAATLIHYRDQLKNGLSHNTFLSGTSSQDPTYDVQLASTHGFSLSFDQKKYYASAISDDNGQLYLGSELATKRPYTVVRVAPYFTDASSKPASPSALTVTYHPNKQRANETSENVALADGGVDPTKVSRVATTLTSINNQVFKKTTWQTKEINALNPNLHARFVTYSGTVRGDLVTIVISLGLGDTDEKVYQDVIDSIKFDTVVSATTTPTAQTIAKLQTSRSLLDMLTNTATASAATTSGLSSSEMVAALYSPAVIKIYNSYCTDVQIDGKPYITNSCSSVSGSGFFVSQDGYIATNGHVVSASPLDIAISDAISNYANKGDSQHFKFLLALSGLTQAEVPAGATNEQLLGIMIDAMYKIDPSRVTKTNDIQNLLVQVNPKNPVVSDLLNDSKNRKEYTNDPNVLKATLVASNYRVNDGYDGFKASDVAIIKVDGKNFPVTKLGSFDLVTQGADLTILGYPSNASDNGVVDSTTSEVTLTTGKVSSKKRAANSDRRLIETDTTIGHGNSGGPAISDDGYVIGIATYTADGSGDGNGVFNYIRDIKDLKELAAAHNISFDTDSATQAEWEKGINYYASAHYSKALNNFETVKQLYPDDSKVDEFIAAAKAHIANGDDVVDFPWVPIIVTSVIIAFGIGLSIFLIVRHHKKHMIYQAGLKQGSVRHAFKGTPAQKVVVTHDEATGEKKVLTPASLVKPPESVPGIQPNSPAPGPKVEVIIPPTHKKDNETKPDDQPNE